MRRISHHHDLTILGLHKSILEEAGIASFVLNGNSWWLANGEVALLSLVLGKRDHIQNPLFAPVLCLVEDEDFEEALEILKAYQAPSLLGPDWDCPGCGERISGNFEACWQCNTATTIQPPHSVI